MKLTLQAVKWKFMNQLLASFLLVSPAFCADATNPHQGGSATVDESSSAVAPVVIEDRTEPVSSVKAPSVVEEGQAEMTETESLDPEPVREEGAIEPVDSEEFPHVEGEDQGEMMEVTPKDESLEESKEEGVFNDILNNTSFELKAFWSQFDEDFPNDTFVDDSKSAFLGRLKAESSAALNDRWSFNTSLLLSYSTYEDDLRGVFADPGTKERKARILEAKEAYLTFEEDEYDISFGKSLVPVGLSELFSPANRFGLGDAINPMYVEELGVWKATFNYYVEDDSISYSLLPFHERPPSPDGRSRWLGSSGDSTFFGLPDDIDVDAQGVALVEEKFRSSTDLESWGHLLQYNAVREGFDYFGLVHYGPSPYAVVKQESGVNEKLNPLALTLAAGHAKTIDEWKLYAEAAYQNTLNSEDEDFVKHVLGVSYRETEFAEKLGLEEISPIIEYAGEIVTNPQLADNFNVNSKQSRPGRHTLFSRIDFRRNDKWTGVFAVAHNISTRDNFLTGLIQYSYSDNLDFNLERRWFNGRDETQFGRWDANDYIGLNTEYKF
jgi:hypothetical protein